MRANRRKPLRLLAASAAVLISFTTLALVTASPAQADPGCQNGGVYILWARGSGEKIGETRDPTTTGTAEKFQGSIQAALDASGITTHAWAELGNLDGDMQAGDDPNDPGEYPAVPVADWNAVNIFDGAYRNSVAIGTDELIANLNNRYAPSGYNCTNETAVLGGYSQGADVIGTALARTTLTAQARRHIGFVALYGDPRMDARSCPKPAWARGNSPCNSAGKLGPRDPYVPSDFLGRMASWCDQGDGVCNLGVLPPGNHGDVYRVAGGGIDQSTKELVNRARAKRNELTAGGGGGVGSMVFDGRNFLRSSDAPLLYPGHYIMSSDARFVFACLTDGNLALYGPGYFQLWNSNTFGKPLKYNIMQPDGNMVLRGPNDEAWFQTYSSGGGPSHLTMQNDGNAVVYTDPGGTWTWQSYTGGRPPITYTGSDHRGPNEYLYSNMYIQSPDGRYDLVMQPDGNLVFTGPGGHLLWNSGTSGAGNYAVMQPDGNFVVYSAGGAPLWYVTMNGGSLAPGGYIRVQNDGNIVVYNTGGGWNWQSYTAGRI